MLLLLYTPQGDKTGTGSSNKVAPDPTTLEKETFGSPEESSSKGEDTQDQDSDKSASDAEGQETVLENDGTHLPNVPTSF